MFLGDRHDENARRTLWVVGLTAVMMVGEIIAGSIFNSMALLADGFHMATHAGALTVAAIAYAFARRNAHNRRFSFGTGKVGDLAGFASALVLALTALGIGVESVGRLFEPQSIAFGEAALVAVVGLAVNIVSAFLLSGGHDHHHGHHHDQDHHLAHSAQHHDNNLRACIGRCANIRAGDRRAACRSLPGMGVARSRHGHRWRDRHRALVLEPAARHRSRASRHV